MSQTIHEDDERKAAEFAEGAARSSDGFLAEFWGYLRHSKKWWLTPILILLGLLAILSFVVGTGAAPFIYALF